jgi:hypothetical protein
MKKDWWKEINQLRMDRVLDRYWAHLDFDMFYIACELLEKYITNKVDHNSKINLVQLVVKTQYYALRTTKPENLV